MADNTDIPNSDIIIEEKGCETKYTSEDDKESSKQMKITLEEPVDSSSEGLRLSESPNDPVCVLQMSGEQILAPETEDDGVSIIPPSPEAYGDPPYLIPTSPGEEIGEEDSDENNSSVENVVKSEITSNSGKSILPKDNTLSGESPTDKIRKPSSPCCKISFSQDSTDESLEITETQTSVGEIEVCALSRKRKHTDEQLSAINKGDTCSDKLSVQQIMSRSKNHDEKVARIETERAEEPSLNPTDAKQTCVEEEAEKQHSESPYSKAENSDSQIDSEEKEWHLQLSCATEPMEYSVTEGICLEETHKDASNVAEALSAPDKEVIPEGDNCSGLPKDDATLPLFQIQKPASIEQSIMTVDAREDTTVFAHIQNLSLKVSGELTDEYVGTPEEHHQLNSTVENSSAVKNTSQSPSHSDTASQPITSTQISADQMKDKNIEDKHLLPTQANGDGNNLSQLISHKVIKGRKHPVIFTDSLEEPECISYKDSQTSSSIDTSRSLKYHKASVRNKDGKHPINAFPNDKSNSVKSSEICVLSPSKTSDQSAQVNIDSFECSKCSNRQNLCSPSSDKLEVKDHKTRKKVITAVRHVTTQQFMIGDKIVKTAVIEEEDEPIVAYYEDDISPTISSHRSSISHTSFSSGELADVSSLITSKSISSSSSSSLFAFPNSTSLRRSNSREKTTVTQNRVHTHQDASTDTDIWSDTKADKYSALKKNKSKWKFNSESNKTSSLRSSSPEISISDVSQPKQSRTVLPGVRVMARWKDGCFYPGKVCAQDSDKNKWVILYDDGGKIPVTEKDLIVVSLLDKGQRVLALSEDGCYDPGIIKDYYKEGKEIGYVVERDYNETTRYPRSSVILSNEEALSLLKSNADTTSTSSEMEQGNITEGRRRQSPRVNVSQVKKEKLKSCQDPFIDVSLSDQQNSSSDGIPQRRSARKKLKHSDEKGSMNPDAIIHSPQQFVSPRRKDSPSCKRKPHSTTNEQSADIPSTSKKLSHSETAVKTGEKESTFKSPKVQKAERCKISKLAGEAGKKDNEKLFEGFAFLLSTADRKNDDNEHQSNNSSTELTDEEVIPIDNVPFDKNLVEKEIEVRGGTVLEKIEGIQNMEGKKILLLSNDYLRTIKYIHCLAEGIPCVSHIWVKDCCATNTIQNYMTYLLPSGFDIINKCVVEWHGKKDVLKGLHVLLFSFSNKHFVDTWSPVLMASEAKIVHRIPPQRKSTDFPCIIDAVITDSSCPQNILRRATQMKIPIISVEWIIQCLITGHRLPVDSHPKFSYDFSA